MNEVYFDGRLAARVPAKWNELKRWQLLALTRVMYTRMAPGLAIVLMTTILLEVWRRPRMAWTILWRLDAEGRYDLARLVDWVFEGKNDLTRNGVKRVRLFQAGRLKQLKFPFMCFYGPGDEIPQQCFLEFIKCETYFLRWKSLPPAPLPVGGGDAMHNDQVDVLNKMMAVLYRPARKVDALYDTGDKREPYNDALIEMRAKMMAGVPLHVKIAVMRFYEGVREHVICQKFREVFPVPDPEKDTPDEVDGPHGHMKRVRPAGGGWLDQLRMLAGGSLNMDRYANEVDRDIALYDLNMKIREQREMERESARVRGAKVRK